VAKENDAPPSESQLRIEKLGCGFIIATGLVAGLIGWKVSGVPGGVFGLALGVPAATAVFSVVVRFCIWAAGILRWRQAG
jgi:hypothetical protein